MPDLSSATVTKRMQAMGRTHFIDEQPSGEAAKREEHAREELARTQPETQKHPT